MKKYLILLVILLSMLISSNANPNADKILKNSTTNFFIENKGQWDPEVKFLARIGGMNAWITDYGIVYDFYKIKYDESLNIDSLRKTEPSDWMEKRNENARRLGHVVKMSFIDSWKQTSTDRMKQQTQCNNSRYEVQGRDKLETYYNYFIGNDSTRWASYVGLYKEILIKNVFEGIDYRLYFEKGMLRYDLIILPYADLEQFRMKFEGQEGLEVNENGELVIMTSIGDVKNQKIYAYQNSNPATKETEIPVSFNRNEDGTIGFSTKNYNKHLSLTIDPLIYSTFIGGAGADTETDMAISNTGEAYVTGYTSTSDYPTTSEAYDVSHNGGFDVFVSKLNINGTNLIYSTFIGGTNISDQAMSIVVDGTSAAYVTGRTYSSDYPTTSGAFDLSYSGNADIFVTKLNASGTSLIYSTFIGEISNEYVYSITEDGTGAAYITGMTMSPLYPTTSGAYDESYNGGIDVFVTKLNTSGSSLVYSTFIGGTNSECGNTITVDGTGAAYITGNTYSSSFPTTNGVIDESYNGNLDVFVTKLNVIGSALIYSTFIGGNSLEEADGITLDGMGEAYVTGWTDSPNYPTTNQAYDDTHNGSRDIFVSKLNPNGTTMVYSTFIGGAAFDYGKSITIDGTGAAYITGNTYSPDYPTRIYAYDVTFNGNNDVIISKLNASGSNLLYSSFIGGTGFEGGESIFLDNTDVVYVSGSTSSPEYPTTINAYDCSHNGSGDVFVTKLSLLPPPLTTIKTGSINPSSYCTGSSISIPFTITGEFNSGNIFTAQLSDESGNFLNPVNIGTLSGTSQGTIIATIPSYTPEGYGYRVRVISSNPEITGSDNGANITINPLPTPQINDAPNPVCVGNTYEYTSYLPGGIINKWGAVGGTIVGTDNGFNVNILWDSKSSGTVTLEQTNFLTGCKDSVFQTITINPLPAPQITDAPNPVCAGNPYEYTGNSTDSVTNKWKAYCGTIIGSDVEEYVNIIWDSVSSGTVTLLQTNSTTGCNDSVSKTIIINNTPNAVIVGNNKVCQGSTEYYSTSSIVNGSNTWTVEQGTITGSSSADTIEVLWGARGNGNVTLMKTDTLTNCADTVVKEVLINPLPIVTFESPVDSLCLSDSGIVLSGGNPVDGIYSGNGVNNSWFDPVNAGDYEITYTYTDGKGCSNSAIDTIKVLPNPEKPTITQIKRKLISSEAISYQWYLDSTKLPSANDKEYTPIKAGNYQVEVIDKNGCKRISDVFYYGSIGVDETQENKNMLIIKPNPFSETTSLILNLNESGIVSLEIDNLIGINVYEIYRNKYMESRQHVIQFNVNSLPDGIYCCTLRIGNHVETVKMVVVR